MEKKIIHLTFRGYENYFPNKDDPNFYLGGWATLQAKSAAKYSIDIKQEVWRPEYETDKIETSCIQNVKGRLFPYKKFGKKYHLNPLSLLRELKLECKKKHVVINLHYMHNISSLLILFLFKKYPIFIHHHGSIPFRYRNNKKGAKKIFNKLLIKIDEYLLKNVDYFSVISKTEKEYLESFVGTKNVILEQGRKYYADYKPIAKCEARKKLGLPLDKKIMIYVGYYYKLKGVDALLKTYSKLKKEYDIQLLMVGGNPDNELYDEVIKSGAFDFGIVENKNLALYYSASDVYVLYSDNDNLVKFGGFGTAPIEAMACNIPIVSTQLVHFPNEDWKRVGEIPKNQEDLFYCIKKVLENPNSYTPRKTSKIYYDLENIIKGNIQIYKDLIRQYYFKE